MAIFPISNGIVQLSTSTPVSTDPFKNGIRVKTDASAAYIATSSGLQSQNGFLLDVNGAVICVDASAGLPAGVVWRNGLPFDSSGALCISAGAASTYSNGIPLAPNGSVSTSGIGAQLLIDTYPILVSGNPILFS